MLHLISIQNALIVSAVVARITRAHFSSLIADETTDRHKQEQLAIVIHYVLQDDKGVWKCYEDPVANLDVLADIKATDDSRQ